MFWEMFHGSKWSVKSFFMNSMAILWQIRGIYCECFEIYSSNFYSLNLIHICDIWKFTLKTPIFFISFCKNIRQLWPFCLDSAKKWGFTSNDSAPGIFIYWKVLYFLTKITWYFLYCLYSMLHNLHRTKIFHIDCI